MQGKTVVVTGGFGILGSAVAEAAKTAGAHVAVLDLAPEPRPELRQRLGDTVLYLGGVDLGSAEAAQAAMAAVKARFGRIDVLVNVAGGFRWETVADGDAATWDKLYAMNVKSALNASKAALPELLASGAGRIVNIGANGALKAAAGMGAYGASKAGVHRLTEALAEELKGSGVTVNAVLPSIIDTPVNRADMPDADFGEWVKPAELARIILFLAAEASGAITGALLPVTGGV